LVFNLIDTYNNNTASLGSFIKFYRLSLLYLEYDPAGTQRLTIDIMHNVRKSFVT